MKKALSLILALVLWLSLSFSLCACGNKTIELTTENIDQYIACAARYKNHRDLHYLTPNNLGESCDIDFHAYPIQQGSFSNVKITVQANVPNEFPGTTAAPWVLDGKKGEPIQFTFQLSANGEYSYVYAIECYGNASDLYGDCELTIISVSGTFTPAN